MEILTVEEVMEITTLSRSSIHRKEKDSDSDFPSRRKLGKARVGFLKKEINEWLENTRRINAREKENKGTNGA